jgi:hypothetical protein
MNIMYTGINSKRYLARFVIYIHKIILIKIIIFVTSNECIDTYDTENICEKAYINMLHTNMNMYIL